MIGVPKEVDTILRDFEAMMDKSMWRDEKDPTIAFMAIGNVTEWLAERMSKLLLFQKQRLIARLDSLTLIETYPHPAQGELRDDEAIAYNRALNDMRAFLDEK